jgi:hypothetical protein
MERMGTDQLGWIHGDSQLASHPGGLNSKQSSMQNGITDGHGTKDKLRANAVMHQFDADKKKLETATSQAEKLKEANKAVDNMAMIGKAYTTQHFMQPAPQLLTMDPSGMSNAYHSRFGQIVGNDKTLPSTQSSTFPRASMKARSTLPLSFRTLATV